MPLTCDNSCILLVQVVVIVIKGDLGSCSPPKLDLITFLLVLLLLKSTEWVDITGSCNPWESAFALAIELKLALNLLDHHLFQCEDVHILHSIIFRFTSRFRLLI